MLSVSLISPRIESIALILSIHRIFFQGKAIILSVHLAKISLSGVDYPKRVVRRAKLTVVQSTYYFFSILL